MDTRERIFELLKQKKISQTALTEALGLKNVVTITDWKRGKSNSYNDYLPQIAEALGTTVEYLATGKGSPSPAGNELLESFAELTPEEQADTLAYIAFLKSRRHKP